MSHKATVGEAFEEIYQVIFGGISDNMASLVQYINYGPMNTTYTSSMGYYLIKFVSESYTLQDDTTWDGQLISAFVLAVKA